MILFRLAGHLGKTVEEVEHGMSSPEFAEWIAYWNVEPPFDPWYAVGLVCSTLCNLWSKRRSKPEDFMPRTKPRKMSPKQIMATMDLYRGKR